MSISQFIFLFLNSFFIFYLLNQLMHKNGILSCICCLLIPCFWLLDFTLVIILMDFPFIHYFSLRLIEGVFERWKCYSSCISIWKNLKKSDCCRQLMGSSSLSLTEYQLQISFFSLIVISIVDIHPRCLRITSLENISFTGEVDSQ